MPDQPPPRRPIPKWASYVFFIRGVVALALGIGLLVAGTNLNRLGNFIAVYWMVAALLTLRWVRANRGTPGRRLGFIAGTTALVAGAAVVLRPLLHGLLSEKLLLDVLGVSAIATGLMRLLGTFHDDQLGGKQPRRRYRFVIGPLEIVLGVALFLADEGTAGEIRVALAVWGLSTGTFLLLDALMLRRLTRPTSRVS